MPDRAILSAQTRRVVVDRLVIAQAAEYVGDGVPVGVKLLDLAPDVLVGRIAEHLKLGAVGAEDGAVGAHPVHGHRAVLEEALVDPDRLLATVDDAVF